MATAPRFLQRMTTVEFGNTGPSGRYLIVWNWIFGKTVRTRTSVTNQHNWIFRIFLYV